MKVGIGIVSLVFMFILGTQSTLIGLFGSVGHLNGAGVDFVYGILGAFGFLFGGAFVFKLPNTSSVIFMISGIILIVGASTSSFGYLFLWGGSQLLFAYLCKRVWWFMVE